MANIHSLVAPLAQGLLDGAYGGNSVGLVATPITFTPNSANQTRIFGDLAISNSDTSDAWVQFFDVASAPTVGSTTPTKSFFAPKGKTVVYQVELTPANGWWFAGTTTATGGSGATAATLNFGYSAF